MSIIEPFGLTTSTLVMGVIGFMLVSFALYVIRGTAHSTISSIGRSFQSGFEIVADSVTEASQRLNERNREVLLAAGLEAGERIIEREFERINTVVQRDIAAVPTLERAMKESISKIEADYQQSTEVPPEPPGWAGVVDAVAQMPGKADPMVARILEQIHTSLVDAQSKAATEYRSAIQSRHKHLDKMRAQWRKLQQYSEGVNTKIMRLLERCSKIDRYMEEYEGILNKTDRAVRSLSTSSMNQFLISGLVLAIAIGGGVINFQLIARPMAEMVGGNSTIGSFKTSDIAALVIILVEVSIGIFMMESLRITRLFPMIGALPDKLRVRMIWVTFGILLSLASVEAGLAYMRELLLQDELATNALLRGAAAASGTGGFMWITTVAQMGMGFILPFALVFTAIPLENFIFSLRTVVGIAGGGVLRGFALLLRMSGGILFHIAELTINVYDMLIFVPLWIEARFKPRAGSNLSKSAPKTAPNTMPNTVKEATP